MVGTACGNRRDRFWHGREFLNSSLIPEEKKIQEEDAVSLNGEQLELLKNYMNLYFESLSKLELYEITDLFAEEADTESKRYGGLHFFTLRNVNGKWHIKEHMQFDTFYLILLRQDNGGDLNLRYVEEMPGYLQQIWEKTEERLNRTTEASEPLQADNQYNRDAAADYALEYVGKRNPQWQDYTGRGDTVRIMSLNVFLHGEYQWIR